MAHDPSRRLIFLFGRAVSSLSLRSSPGSYQVVSRHATRRPASCCRARNATSTRLWCCSYSDQRRPHGRRGTDEFRDAVVAKITDPNISRRVDCIAAVLHKYPLRPEITALIAHSATTKDAW